MARTLAAACLLGTASAWAFAPALAALACRGVGPGASALHVRTDGVPWRRMALRGGGSASPAVCPAGAPAAGAKVMPDNRTTGAAEGSTPDHRNATRALEHALRMAVQDHNVSLAEDLVTARDATCPPRTLVDVTPGLCRLLGAHG